ncbi:TPM domain-containing protein [Winogradskyella psychrotolerans]|uniref:TPM domain-containing protein n=1 Tax=Winogradskyella psychrotolerans TaxID=1344585 RepID=UPI001C07A7F0|nr:TPM domain-containing protein [Winogradskyella psychrotolerans]MBU2927132.1 TPM domain-containing protein [Winogradskyella psychrotolerans]
MSKLEDFLSAEDEQEIVEAIRIAESQTSGEIRVHIEQECDGDVYEHALEVFHDLKMDNTAQRNGVLIYIAVENKSFVICGDQGINNIVGADFWNSTRNKIAAQFKSQNFKQGIIEGVIESGKSLSKHFPWQHNDINELDNTISKS